MRHNVYLVESSELDVLETLADACANAGAGFYFEEGGCFGMALALHRQFAHLKPQLVVVSTPMVHAAVRIGGHHYDYQGRVLPNTESIFTERGHVLSRDAFIALAIRDHGHTLESLTNDESWAEEIIASILH